MKYSTLKSWQSLATACVEVLGVEDVDVILEASEHDEADPVEAIYKVVILEEPSTVEIALSALSPNDRVLVEAAYGLGAFEPATLIEASGLVEEGTAMTRLRGALDQMREKLLGS